MSYVKDDTKLYNRLLKFKKQNKIHHHPFVVYLFYYKDFTFDAFRMLGKDGSAVKLSNHSFTRKVDIGNLEGLKEWSWKQHGKYKWGKEV